MIRRPPEVWAEIKRQAQEVLHTELGLAIQEELTHRANTKLSLLEESEDTFVLLRAQGARLAHKRDIMVLEDLIRQADAEFSRRKKNARRTKKDG